MGLSDSDFGVMDHMAKFMESMPGGSGEMFTMKPGSAEWEQEHGYQGVPVKTVRYEYGQTVSIEKVKEVKRSSFDSDVFNVPAGFKEKNMMEGMGGFGQ